MNIIKFIPNKNSKYHFGEGTLAESSIVFHSNSLFSAIVNNFIKLYGEQEFNNYANEIKKLKISSLFPACYHEKKEILFIPRPMTMLGFNENTQKKNEDCPKDIKKIKFISLDALNEHNKCQLNKITIGKEYLISKKEADCCKFENPNNMNLFKKTIEQKVSIDRIKGTTLSDKNDKGQLYAIEYIIPLKNVGFYFLIDDFDKMPKTVQKKLKASIQLIKDEGLGGKRNIGAGTFESIEMGEKLDYDFNIDEIELNKEIIINNKKYKSTIKETTLSISIPKNEEEFNKFETYQLIKIGGYITPPPSKMKNIKKLKKNVYALLEGSIINKKIGGNILNIAPDKYEYEVLLNGNSVSIPMICYELNDEGENEYI